MTEQRPGKHSYQTRSVLQRWATEECRFWRKEAVSRKPEAVPLIDGKIHHIQDVIENTILLIDTMGGTIEGTQIPWNVPMAIAVAQVHDVKRFYEGYHYGKYNKTGYDHPKHGAVKFLQDFYSGKFADRYEVFQKEKIDPLIVYYGALHHGEREYQSYAGDGASSFLYDAYGWLIRDADKLANVLHIDHSVKVSERERKDVPYMSPAVEESLVQGYSVLYTNVESKIDGLGAMMGWWFDVRYHATKEAWMKNHVFEQYLAQMHRWGLQGESYERVSMALEHAAQKDGFSLNQATI